MAILFCASEMFPYAKSGGLGDVAHSLPEALREYESVYTMLPLYQVVDRDKYKIVYSGLTFEYGLNGVNHQFDIFTKKDNPYEIFIYNPILCDREDLYHDKHGDYGDNGLRFGLFSYACIETMFRMQLNIEAIHINDWQTSPIAILAKTFYNLKQKIVLTIHNLAYQGIFDKSVMDELQLDWDKAFKPESLEYFDKVNFLKGAIYFSDEITTVSPTYAKEIQTPLYGYGLDDILKKNNYKLKGILNGISYETFNPKTDEMLYENFDIDSFDKRKSNKKNLLKEIGFEDSQKPLFVFIGRFTDQKGIRLLIDTLDMFKDYEASMVILGSGEPDYNTIFKNISISYPNVYIKVGYDEGFARKLYASADFLLMPSIFEPCGLNQMISMRYGAIPIVSSTGGLVDTVIDFTKVNFEHINNYQGIGVSYEEHNLFWFIHTIAKAISLYANKEKFQQITLHNMGVDYSWKHSAKLYLELYKG